MQVTILAWLVEFFGYLMVFLGTFIFGHGDSVVTLMMQTLTLLFCHVIQPCVYLINRNDLKDTIIGDGWRRGMRQLFNI